MIDELLEKEYSLQVVAEQEGGYTIFYPDLPGCVTVIESLDELPVAAREIKELWIESALEDGQEIPVPTYPPDHNGRILLRLPKSLHRELAEAANSEDVSLNQYLVSLLSSRNAIRILERRIEQLESVLTASRHSRVAD